MSDKRLSEEGIKRLPVPETGNKVHYFAGAKLQGAVAPRGFGVRVTAAGARSFVMNYRLQGREYRYTIGTFPDWSAVRAVKEARDLRQRIDRGENPLEARKAEAVEDVKTVDSVLDDWMRRHARAKGKDGKERLRSADSIESALARLVRPRIGRIDIYKLSRRNIAEMLDHIQDTAGPVAADRARSHFCAALRWYAERDDKFNIGHAVMRFKKRAEGGARARILSDDEIRALWAATAAGDTFSALCRLLLLTGQRRCEASDMPWAELGRDGTWVIPAGRSKNKRLHVVPLSGAARAVIEAQPRAGDFVFSCSTGSPYAAFSRGKLALDKAMGDSAQPWVLHDLRRTARSLMSRAGVQPHIAERVLNHTMTGVEGVYDRHDYTEEKRIALEALAGMIERIINPPAGNVLPLRREG
ncbi:MAG TPA: integrase arm-type DNA-binding domain-containing protein [Dongiaceae bacterium]|nr:integrase arm-type DNA-binding domain-containing protein [Dongiaceae bacterium]